MVLYSLRRVLAGLALTVLVTLITFLLLSRSFEDMIATILGPDATPEKIAETMHARGYDRPLLLQYGEWLGHVIRGDLGVSAYTSLGVGPIVLQRMSVTLSVIVPALVVSVVLSILLGVWSASRGGVVDRVAQGISLIGHLIPELLIAIILVFVVAVTLHVLPATGFTSLVDSRSAWLRSITLPAIALIVGGMANITAQIRGAMIVELRKDYVRTLRTSGLSPRSIVIKHALRNAGSPALTVMSLEFLALLSHSVIIENVFALPGYGSFAFSASLQIDVPVIMGVTLVSVLLVTVVNLAADLANGWLNPKARLH
ncbi:ABC transporter permease [Microlunatus flavus]|uniref:Peptide/nickel transport system permease protein n=1 Tax=Microlunatus flavus TaxID=1036181 RepID=A0A1H9A9V2_9ACTN|nr:ABC transporter permease [Microlunatus flavus]SEP72758.1 peptide/nickel transport system permease protein [Microlunatus flavus]